MNKHKATYNHYMLTPLRNTLALYTFIPMLPVLLPQGIHTRHKVPRLGEAKGSNRGIVGGSGNLFKLVMIGESTVAGVGARTHEHGLAAQTAHALHTHLNRPAQWHAIGKNGIRAAQVRTHLLPQLEYKPDLIFIGLGVNDVTHFSTRHRWQTELSGLFQDIHLALGDIPIIMSGLPPMHRFPALPQPLRWYLGERARIMGSITQTVCRSFYHVTYLPIPDLPDPAYFCTDQFHPSELGYAKWGERVCECVSVRVME